MSEKTIHATLMEKFPVRRTREQKADFRAWASAFCEERGWRVTVEEPSKGRQKNMIIGDPEHAAVLFSAHYDTPANNVVPNLMIPCNMPLFVLWQALIVCVLIAFGLAVDFAAGALGASPRIRAFAFIGGYFALLLLMNLFPNKHNANDNTSGVAAVLQMIDTMPAEDRAKCAFLLFDEEEHGCRGSKLYAKDHAELAWMRLLVNLDCVGDGDTFLFSAPDPARRCPGYSRLLKVLADRPGRKSEFVASKYCRIRSDHRAFKCGIGAAAFTRGKLGCITGRIHTGRDTVCSQENLDWISGGLCDFVSGLRTE